MKKKQEEHQRIPKQHEKYAKIYLQLAIIEVEEVRNFDDNWKVKCSGIRSIWRTM